MPSTKQKSGYALVRETRSGKVTTTYESAKDARKYGKAWKEGFDDKRGIKFHVEKIPLHGFVGMKRKRQ